MSVPAEDDDRARRLDEAAADYLELRASARPIDRQQWLGQYPDLTDDSAALLRDLDQWKPVLTRPKSGILAARMDAGIDTLDSRQPPAKLDSTAGKLGENGTALPRYRLR